MKNSLFKRAVAAVSAVPLALTQCLTVANAVTVSDAGASVINTSVNADAVKEVTVDSILKIVPDESDGVKYEEITGDAKIFSGETADELLAEYAAGREDAKVFTKDSGWNLTAYSLIKQIDKKTGTINIDKLKENAVKRVKNHSEAAKQALNWLSNVDYQIEENGDITLTATLGQPSFSGEVEHTPAAILAKYGIKGVDFSAVKVSGKFVAKLGTSALSSDTSVKASLVFESDAKGTITAGKLPAFAKDVVQQLLEISVNAVNASDISEDQKAAALAELNDEADWYLTKIEKGEKNLDKYLTDYSRSEHYENVSGLIADINQAIKNRGRKFQFKATATEILTSGEAKKAFDAAIKRANNASSSYTVNITADAFGKAIDAIYDIDASAENGKGYADGKYDDAEAADVAAFFKTYELPTEYEVLADFKAGYANGDATKVVSDGSVSANGDFQRVVVVAPVTTTTTTTTTSTTSTTETTTTATSTTDSDTETSTTATSTTDSDTDTTTTATSTTDSDTETTTTATSTSGTDSETTTETTTTATGTESTTSTETTSTVTTTTATDPDTQRPVYYKDTTAANVHIDSNIGFYLNIDEQFNMGQINDIYYSVDENRIWYYADDNSYYKTETLKEGERHDINVADLDFGTQKPENSYQAGTPQFAYPITIYAKNAIEDLGVAAGEPLKFVAGNEVTVIAYIGVKGDADLDHRADATDASAVLAYYAELMTGGTPETTQFSPNTVLVKGADDILDQFAAFLADVDAEKTPEDRVASNYKDYKVVRKIDAGDASYILNAYSYVMTGSVPNRAMWDEVLG